MIWVWERFYSCVIWLQVKTGRGPPGFITFLYRNLYSSFVWFDEFVTMMDRVQDHKHTNDILLLGDFKIDMFKYNPLWASTLSLYNLHQCVQSATRVILTTSTPIDHICVNNPDKMMRKYIPHASVSDHYPVFCALYCEVPRPKTGKHTTVTTGLEKNRCRCFSQWFE